jgi:hypothetical protein
MSFVVLLNVTLEEALTFLNVSFSLQNVLLQSEEELMSKRASELVSEGAASKPKKTIGKMKVQGTKSIYSFHLHTLSARYFWFIIREDL